MAEELYYDKINRYTDWGGDDSTGNLPVAGSAVQDFIKSELNSKIGVVYLDDVSNRYLCFANDNDKDLFLSDRSKTYLIIGAIDAPSKYKAKIKVDSNYKAVLINSKENYLIFDYEITNNDEIFIDNISYEVSVTKNGKTSKFNGTGVHGKPVSINMDEFITLEGTTEAIISITGQITNATASYIVTYEVVNLSFESEYDVSQIYNLTLDVVEPLVINYSIFGTSNLKYIDWYIDGEYLETDTIQGGTAEAIVDNKRISLLGLNHGVHNIQFRAYVIINGENFYTDTLYREFMVISDSTDTTPMIAIETIIPKEYPISNSIKLYNAVQYELYSISYGVYNPKNLEYTPVQIYLENEFLSSVNAPNQKELIHSFTANEPGDKTIKFIIGDYEKSISVDVSETIMDLQEISNNLTLSLSAVGRTNQDNNRDEWSYGEYTTVFEGFNWSAASGWNDNRLFISEGMSIITNIKPLLTTTYGKTIEIEFETFNVVNDDAVICDMRDSNGIGLLMTASKATMTVGFGDKESVSTNYKANENVRISFVLDSTNKLAMIYINGVVSGAVALSKLSVDKYLSFVGTSEAGIKIKQLRIYDTQLSSEQILNNYILYRDTISDMKYLYNRNDVLDGQFISIEKISNYIPVILLTGEEIFWLESQKDTDIEIKIDVEYINKQDPTHQFKFYGGCCRIQGTSSAGYVRKNWRIYSKRKERYIADVYDYRGVLSTDKKRRIAFKEGAVPVNCWTLKADFAESSSTHNTGAATLWNDVMYNAYHTTNGYVCRTNAQKAAIDNKYEYDCRTTVDGFPIVVFARRNDSDEYSFMGKYNFNNDKSTENVFGFCDIPGFDDVYIPGYENQIIPDGEMNAGKEYTYGNKMQCWEVRENEDPYALFRTTEGWYDPQLDESGNIRLDEDGVEIKSWASGFEARYPDDGNEADTSDLKAFADWIVGCSQENFAVEKHEHFDLWKMAAYYVYLMRFGAVDQVVKNSMFTSEDGKHWYFINYDNDTILGLDNSGNIVFPPTITRQTKSGATYAYAGHESKMWNLLEADTEFMSYYVPEIDNVLFNGELKYENVLRYFNTNQSDKWCERIYNEDADYKYVKPYIAGTVNELAKMHGSRKSHRTWWLSKRFQLMDAKFSNVNYRGKHIHMKLDGAKGAEFTIKAADYMYFGCEYNKNPWAMGVELNKGETYTFYKASAEEDSVNGKDFVMGDPIYIYSPLYIEELDLSKISSYIYVLEFGKLLDEVTNARMKKLIIGGQKSAKPISSLSGLNVLTNLEYLDLTGIDYPNIDISSLLLLKTLILTNSTINTLTLPEGCMIEELYINNSLKYLECNGLPKLKLENIYNFNDYHVPSIKISNSPLLTDNFGFYYNWIKNVKSGDSLILTDINWTDVNPSNLIEFGKLKSIGTLSLKGKITIASPTIEEVETLQFIFGDNCFTNNAELWISAPESVFIHGPQEVRSGDSNVYTTTIFSDNPGTVEWQIESGEEFVSNIISNQDNTGTLITIEDEISDHIVIIKAIHKPANTSEDSYYRIATYEILVKKTVYATEGEIIGNATLKKNEIFTLQVGPDGYNGDYSTEWLLSGESYNNGSISIINSTQTSCTVAYTNKVVFDLCSITAIVTNKNGTQFNVSLTITVTDDTVLMTSTSNPEVIAICYAQGWCANSNVMYKQEAQVVTDIGSVFQKSNIRTFNELEEFKNIRSIPVQAFFQCSNLESITVPMNVETFGSFCFGSTKLTELTIPNNVTSIHHTSFDRVPLTSFKVENANVTYVARDGVLMSQSGSLIKYPEGKLDTNYVVPDSIITINQHAFYGTKLKTITIGDNVTSLSEECIYQNDLLQTINFGSALKESMFGRSILLNKQLVNINVSENNPVLCSINGVVYNQDGSVLYKYPEGRTEFVIESSVKNISKYSVQQSELLSLVIPANVEVVGQYAFFACSKIVSVSFEYESKLSRLENNCFQLLSVCVEINLPKTIISIGSDVFTSCKKLAYIKLYSEIAPSFTDTSNEITTAFGKLDTLAGSDVKGEKILYVPANAVGYDNEEWTSSILSTERNNFVLSQTL